MTNQKRVRFQMSWKQSQYPLQSDLTRKRKRKENQGNQEKVVALVEKKRVVALIAAAVCTVPLVLAEREGGLQALNSNSREERIIIIT
jgi:hypothetical protein